MKQFRRFLIAGFFFVLITGTLSHFLYEWSGNCFFVGLFTPVNESTWEHMKLLFFPMLLYSLMLVRRFSGTYPCIVSSASLGILSGTALIPVLFYAYTFILGRNYFILDLLVFFLSVAAAFLVTWRFTLSCRARPFSRCLLFLVCLCFLFFLLFTYCPPGAELFAAA